MAGQKLPDSKPDPSLAPIGLKTSGFRGGNVIENLSARHPGHKIYLYVVALKKAKAAAEDSGIVWHGLCTYIGRYANQITVITVLRA